MFIRWVNLNLYFKELLAKTYWTDIDLKLLTNLEFSLLRISTTLDSLRTSRNNLDLNELLMIFARGCGNIFTFKGLQRSSSAPLLLCTLISLRTYITSLDVVGWRKCLHLQKSVERNLGFQSFFYFENGQVWPPPPQYSHWKLEQLSQDPPQVCYRSVIIGTNHSINSRDSSDLLNLLRSFNVFKSVSDPTRGNVFMENFFNYLKTSASISDGQIA